MSERIKISKSDRQGSRIHIKRRGEDAKKVHRVKKWNKYAREIILLFLLGTALVAIGYFILSSGDHAVAPEQKLSVPEESLKNSNLEIRDHHRITEQEDLIDGVYHFRFNNQISARIVNELVNLVSEEQIHRALLKLYSDHTSEEQILSFIPDPPLYEINVYLEDSIYARKTDYKINNSIRKSSLIILDDLNISLYDSKFTLKFIEALSETLAWTVDLQHIDANSRCRFRTIYQETKADSSLVAVSILAIEFMENGTIHHLFRYRDGEYYDLSGESARRQFLRSPIPYSQISSPYGIRINPISGKIQKHQGTDFAAPAGTPIRALANGVVEENAYTSGNGNFVKLKHDQVYRSQYLHMIRKEESLKIGTEVKQGMVIGYVGSTGSSTGPHVCLRFWKDNQQVDFLKEQMPANRALAEHELTEFQIVRDSLMNDLSTIGY